MKVAVRLRPYELCWLAELYPSIPIGVPPAKLAHTPDAPAPKDDCVVPSDAPGSSLEIRDGWIVRWKA